MLTAPPPPDLSTIAREALQLSTDNGPRESPQIYSSGNPTEESSLGGDVHEEDFQDFVPSIGQRQPQEVPPIRQQTDTLTVRHSGRKTHPPKRLDEESGYGYSTTLAEPPPISSYAHFVHSFTAAASEDPYWVPRNYREAFTCSEASQYHKVMDREMDSHTKNQTWELEEPPPDAHILPGTWVYTKKRPPNQPVIYKACWCVCGNRQ